VYGTFKQVTMTVNYVHGTFKQVTMTVNYVYGTFKQVRMTVNYVYGTFKQVTMTVNYVTINRSGSENFLKIISVECLNFYVGSTCTGLRDTGHSAADSGFTVLAQWCKCVDYVRSLSLWSTSRVTATLIEA
jgi:hypothetical protein